MVEKNKKSKSKSTGNKKISAKENNRLTMSETYVEPIHNCDADK